jgi:hypothetical protein
VNEPTRTGRWSILQFDRFVERQSPPNTITVLEGDFEQAAITHAVGEPSGGGWGAGDPDQEGVDFQNTTPARPMGEPVWLTPDAEPPDPRHSLTRRSGPAVPPGTRPGPLRPSAPGGHARDLLGSGPQGFLLSVAT